MASGAVKDVREKIIEARRCNLQTCLLFLVHRFQE